MANEITTYKDNSKVIQVSIPTGYTGYTVDFVVDEKEYGDNSHVFFVTGVTPSNNVAVINITATQNDIDEKVYWYQINMVNGSVKYTIAKSTYTVLPSLT